jgi:hypothetical protein
VGVERKSQGAETKRREEGIGRKKKTSDLERDEPNDEGFFYFFL